jgi:hypothetical protein
MHSRIFCAEENLLLPITEASQGDSLPAAQVLVVTLVVALVVEAQLRLTQSLPTSQPAPTWQASHVGPPQSTPVSLPFLTPSPQEAVQEKRCTRQKGTFRTNGKSPTRLLIAGQGYCLCYNSTVFCYHHHRKHSSLCSHLGLQNMVPHLGLPHACCRSELSRGTCGATIS